MRFVSGSGFHEFRPVNSILPRASYALFLFLFLLDFFFRVYFENYQISEPETILFLIFIRIFYIFS